MKVRIFRSMMLLTLFSLLLLTVALCIVFYFQFSGDMRREIREYAEMLRNNDAAAARRELDSYAPLHMRVTLIQPDGTVLYDNTVPAESLPNHLHREEVQMALAGSFGESIRYSDTLQAEIYYYALCLSDGSVLRVSKTTRSIAGMFSGVLPMVTSMLLFMGIAGFILSGQLTRRIVAPINAVNLENEPVAPYDELAPFIKTIAEQRLRIAKQLTELQNRADTISAIMDNMNEGMLLIDSRSTVLSANKSALRIFNRKNFVSGQPLLMLVRNPAFTEHVRAALAGEAGEMQMTEQNRIYRVYFSPVKELGAMVMLLNITDTAYAERQRREFSANVSHELKTPLTTLYGSAEMLCKGMVKESDLASFYDRIKEEAGRLIALIEDIILIARLDEGGGTVTVEETDLWRIALETMDALAEKAQRHKVAIQLTGEHIGMKANRFMMYELFYNLLDNAIKYNKPGGSVKISLTQTEQQIRLSVADTGIGIPKEAQARVFERFYRVDKSRSRKTGGTGLGLAIVKHIVLTHGGSIALHSAVDKGTLINVQFNV